MSTITVAVDDETARWCETGNVALALRIGIAALSLSAEVVKPVVLAPAPVAIMSSPALGVAGERIIEAALREHFTVRNVAATSHHGDLQVFINHHNICVEVKNYSRTVPATEVAKFLRDVDSTNASGGVFVSVGGTSITGVGTSTFSMRFEHIDGRTVPCAYVVSADPSAAVLAVQMIIDLIKITRALLADMLPDTSSVHEILEQAEALGRLRGELATEITAVTSAMIKTGGRLGTVVASIRSCANRLRDDMPTCTIDRDLLARLDELPAFRRYDDSIKAAVSVIVHAIGLAGSLGIWKLAPKKCLLTTGMGFSWTVVPDFLLPIAMRTPEILADAIAYGKKVTMTTEHLCIEICVSTLDWIVELVSGAGSALP